MGFCDIFENSQTTKSQNIIASLASFEAGLVTRGLIFPTPSFESLVWITRQKFPE